MSDTHITELQAVDFALSAVIAGAFNGLADTGPEAYRRFLTRPIKEKLFRGDYADPADLLRKIAGSMKGKSGNPGAPGKGEPDLPLIAYNRRPGLMGADDKGNINRTLFNEDFTKAYDLTIINVSLEYKMTFLAWDAPTLDKLQVGWFSYITRRGRKNNRFIVPVRIGDEVIQVPATINDPRSIMSSDVSIQFSEGGRILGAETDLTVNTAELTGKNVTPLTELEIHGFATEYITGGYAVRHSG